MASDPVQVHRLAALKKLEDQHPCDKDTGGWEDIEPYLDGSEWIDAYAILTYENGYAYYYFAHTIDQAKKKAISNVGNDIYSEVPDLIVNLDTNKQWTPDWSTVAWNKVTP